MSFLELAGRRQSVRSYVDTPVEREKIGRCVEAARLAPSACNSQPWHFVVVDDPELRTTLSGETYGKLVNFNSFTTGAPALVVVVSKKPNIKSQFGSVVKNRSFRQIDMGIAVENFCLQAADEGLGTCILGWFDEGGIKKALKIPKKERVGLVIALGYPADHEVREKKRKTQEEIISYNSYNTIEK
jgi:nitroreductase